MPRLLLLGDSIIDNGPYLQTGEPPVGGQVQAALPDWIVERRALDGSVTRDALERQCAGIAAADSVVLSSGGNDALQYVELISPALTDHAEGVLNRLWGAREAFRRDYAALLSKIRGAGARLLVFTVYDPAFAHLGQPIETQRAAEAALSLYNDVIQSEAARAGAAALDIRRLFVEAADYANPIEPSCRGGAKLAAAIAEWARQGAL